MFKPHLLSAIFCLALSLSMTCSIVGQDHVRTFVLETPTPEHNQFAGEQFAREQFFGEQSVGEIASESYPIQKIDPGFGHQESNISSLFNGTAFFGLDGSKQPHDFGANANLGMIGRLGFSGPLGLGSGIGVQIGTSFAYSRNAVQVFELLGESTDRSQSYTTIGIFKRMENGLSLGVAHDFLFQDSYDEFSLSQWRGKASLDLDVSTEIGVILSIGDRGDEGRFNQTLVDLQSVDQLRLFIRKQWSSGVATGFWVGIAEGHSEENIVTGTLPRRENQLLFGADLFAPLNRWAAIYGEANLVMPADTGAVDAFLGVEISPQDIFWIRDRNNRYREFLPVATSPSFTTDLTRR